MLKFCLLQLLYFTFVLFFFCKILLSTRMAKTFFLFLLVNPSIPQSRLCNTMTWEKWRHENRYNRRKIQVDTREIIPSIIDACLKEPLLDQCST